MHFTNFRGASTARAISLVAIACLPLAWAGFAADPHQPIRGLLLSVALIAFLFAGSSPVMDRRSFVAAGLAGTLFVASLVAGVASGPVSGIFGVHGRFEGLVSLVLLILAGIAGFRSRPTAPEIRLFARLLAAVIVVEAAVLAYQRFSGVSADGSVGNPVLIAGWLVTAGAFVIGGSFGERGGWRTWLLVAGALGLLACGLTATRGAWLAAAAVLVVVWVVGRAQGRRIVFVGILALVVGVLAAGAASADKVALSDLTTGSAASRIEIWKASAQMVADHPLLGVGPGRFLYEYPAYQTAAHVRIEGGDTRADQAHNVFLQVAVEAGAPAALALVALVGLALTAGFAAARRSDAVALAATLGLVAWSAQAMFGISTIETDGLAWFLGGLCLARGAALGAETNMGLAVLRPYLRYATTGLTVIVAVACGVYLYADASYADSQTYLAEARFTEASHSAAQAVRVDPTSDTYRVALADAEMYRLATGDSESAQGTLRVLDEGLDLEPDSYDLAVARARLLTPMNDQAPVEVWDAFVYAMRLYPRGVAVRQEAALWAQAHGSALMQAQAADELLLVSEPSGF
ncbi:MAG: O-antigen ligase family protein [Actinomycetota bacterium]|nr:O-antigen ligase family protein [Actinomycetota bacterium]